MSESAFLWGAVTQVSPLRVQLDGDSSAIPATPSSLIDPLALAVSDRVRCELETNRLIVHGRYGGPRDGGRTYTGTVSPAWTFGKPDVTLSDGTVVSAFLPANDIDIQPGASVILSRLPGGVWYITAVVSSSPAFLRQVTLALGPKWKNEDAAAGDLSFTGNTVAGPLPQRYSPVAVTKSATGWVVASGLVRSTSAIVAGDVLATLPVGFRPAATLDFAASASSGTIVGIRVNTDGTIVATGSYPSGNWISLANVVFNHTLSTTTVSAFNNSWTNFGSPRENAQYGKDAYGFVFGRGAVKGGSGADGANIFSLPAGFYPGLQTHFVAGSPAGGASAYRAQGSTGPGTFSVNFLSNTPGTTAGVQLEGNVWEDSGSAIAWVIPSLLNSWSQFDASRQQVSFFKRGDGLVALQGLIKGGSIGSTIFVLPEGYRPERRLVRANVTSGVLGTVYIFPSGEVVAGAGSNTWFSLDGILFAAGR